MISKPCQDLESQARRLKARVLRLLAEFRAMKAQRDALIGTHDQLVRKLRELEGGE